jgi:hypothetical protein
MACFDRDRFDGLQGEFYELDVEPDVKPRGEHEDLGYRDQGSYTGKFPKDPADEHVWFFPAYTSYGDYSNTTLVEKSNYRVLLAACEAADQDEDEVPDDCRPFFVTLSSGHDSNSIAVHIERTPDSIVEMLEGLSNYPVLDDSDHSELEQEAQEEAWNDWARDDYRRELEKTFTSQLEAFAERHNLEIDTDVDLSEVSDSDISTHFWHWSNEINEYWESSDMSMWINVEKVAEAAAEELFTDPEAKPEGWEWPEGIPANLAPVFVDPRQTLLPFKEGFPERYIPPPETRAAGPAPLTQQEEALIKFMIRVGWYKKDDRAGLVAHIMRMRAGARGGMNGLEGMSAGEFCVLVRRRPLQGRSGFFDLPSWKRRLG